MFEQEFDAVPDIGGNGFPAEALRQYYRLLLLTDYISGTDRHLCVQSSQVAQQWMIEREISWPRHSATRCGTSCGMNVLHERPHVAA